MRRTAGAALPLLLFAGFALAGNEGRLCVSGAACIEHVRLPAAVPAGVERTFTWRNDERARLICGVIGATSERAEAAEGASVKLRVRSSDARRWPAPATLAFRDGRGREWRADLSVRDVRRDWTLVLPRGTYEANFGSARHQRARRLLTITEASVLDIVLNPLPTIHGRIVDARSSAVLAGALVTVGERNVAVSDAGGRFEFDADPEEWPSSVRISAAGHGTAVVAVPRARVTANLLDVALSAASMLRIRFDRAKAGEGDVAVSLYKRNAGTPEPEAAASVKLSTGDVEATIRDLPPGDYLVAVRGAGPGERLGMRISLDSGTKDVEIAPAAVHLTVRADLNGSVLAGGTVRIGNDDGLWQTGWQRLNERGELRMTLWQAGTMSATLRHRQTLTMPYFERKEVAAADEVEWHLAVPEREIAGTVIDAATQKPIAGANVAWRVRGPPAFSATTTADADGRFRLTAAPPGDHLVLAAADGYLPGQTRTTLLELDRQRAVTVALEPASEKTIRVIDRLGRPAADAAVLDFDGPIITGQRMTNAAGEVAIPIGRGGTRTVFAIPRDGSFAMVRVAGGGEGDATIAVPDGTADIVVRAQTSDAKPIADLWLLVRYNGVLLPFEVQQMLGALQGVNVKTDGTGRLVMRHMPAGFYEMWPAGSAAELRAIALNAAADAPVRVTALAGEVSAVLTFEPAKK
jgi:Carboxypeptidase regulatory-like domain